MFKNRVLRKTFVAKKEEVTGGWGKLHRRWFHDLFNLSVNTLVVIKPEVGVVYVSHMVEKRCACRILTGKPEGKGPLGRCVNM